jgi:hypothetical protein
MVSFALVRWILVSARLSKKKSFALVRWILVSARLSKKKKK